MAFFESIPAEQVAAVLAQPPPRRGLPPPLIKVVRKRAAHGLIGCVGLFFFGFGLPFLYFFTPWNLLRELRLSGAPTLPARIEAVHRTNASENDIDVRRFDYSFQPAGQPMQRGSCYAAGNPWAVGAEATVRYLPHRPTVSCLVGGRLDLFGPHTAFVWLFPLVGGTMAGAVWWRRKQAVRVLEFGLVRSAKVTAVRSTRVEVNDLPQFEITLDFGTGPPVVVRRVFPPLIELAKERQSTGLPIAVLVDPDRPKHLLFPERI